MRMLGSLLSVWMLASVCCLAGCASTTDDAQLRAIAKTPPDFAVELFVEGQMDDTNPRLSRSKYLLEPNFRLHLALGDRAGKDRYPIRFLRLHADQFDQLVRIAQQANLMAEPTSPFADQVITGKQPKDPKRPLIYVSITSWGKTNRYVTTGKDSPPTQVLLDRLILYTGRKLPDDAMDSHRGY